MKVGDMVSWCERENNDPQTESDFEGTIESIDGETVKVLTKDHWGHPEVNYIPLENLTKVEMST